MYNNDAWTNGFQVGFQQGFEAGRRSVLSTEAPPLEILQPVEAVAPQQSYYITASPPTTSAPVYRATTAPVGRPIAYTEAAPTVLTLTSPTAVPTVSRVSTPVARYTSI